MPLPPPLPVDLAGIQLDPAQGLASQLYRDLRERILDGRLRSGTRLPASRELALLLGVSRNTVTRAFDQLYAEGYIEGQVGAGTYVVELAGMTPRPSPAGGGPADFHGGPVKQMPRDRSREKRAARFLSLERLRGGYRLGKILF